MDVLILFTVEYNYSRLIQHEMLKKPVILIMVMAGISTINVRPDGSGSKRIAFEQAGGRKLDLRQP